MDVTFMKNKFNENLNLCLSNKKSNNTFLTRSDYEKFVEKVLKLKESREKKVCADYYVLKRFDIIEVSSVKKLIKPLLTESEKPIFFVAIDEIFDIIHDTHVNIGHGGRNRIQYAVKEKYANVTKEVIMLYLPLCLVCQKKSSNKKRGLVSKPIIEKEFNSRAQLDLIDMQSQEYNGYRFIMNYQDHLTKYVILSPLKSKTAHEVAYNLFKIYTKFGAPGILHHDNGREFVNKVLTELNVLWDGVKVVTGKPRHSQSQG